MIYLLDVNALLAWHHPNSSNHTRFHRWAVRVGVENLRSCALSELGFLRVSMQPTAFANSREVAQAGLAAIKSQIGGFVDRAPSPSLPAWASTAGRTPDAYLAQLASANGMQLATFDASIPGAFVIPELPPS